MRKLFTLLTVALASTAAWAQFSDPELKKATSVKTDGQSEYILGITNSEGETMFYGKGNAWGTRTSAKMAIEEALTVRFTPITQTVDGAEVQCLTFSNYVSDKGGWAAHVDIDDGDHKAPNNGNQSWVDGQGRRGDGFWQLTDKGNGQIELNNILAPGTKFGISKSLATWSADENDYVLSVTEEGGDWDNRLYHIGWAAPKVAVLDELGEETGDSVAAYIWGDENYTTWQAYDAGLYNLKKKISSWFWDEGGYDLADQYASIKTAVEACDKVYEDESCTVEALQAAYDEVLKAVSAAKLEQNAELLEGASLDDPIELFEFGIGVNGDFENGSVEGWTPKMAHQNGGQYQSANYSNGSIKIEHFAESWTGGAQHSSDGKFYQEIDLPAGLYTLEADMIATRQSGGKADSKGVHLFAQNTNEDEDFYVEAATGNNAPEHFSVSFVTKGGTFQIGVRAVSTTCNWIAMDNFKLYYSGQTEMSLEQINLGKTIEGLATRYNNHVEAGDHMGRTALVDAYDALYEAVLAAYENGGLEDPTEYTALGDSLTKAYNAVSASIQDYKQFAKNIEMVEERIAEQEEMSAACAAELADYYDVLLGEYEKAEWTREQIDEIPGVVSDILGKYADVKPGDDVTFYLNNAKFEKDFSGWNVVGATPGYLKNHGQGENANADLCQEVPEENDGLAECYHALFDMSQTIKNLPAGLYTLSVQGFNRHDDGNNESAQLYATFSDGTEQTQDFASIDDYKTEDRLYVKNNADGNPEWMSDAGRDGDTYWVPNGMTGAAWHFVNKKDGENYDYTNKFSILMKEAGDLTVGVRVKNTHQWVIWDNFTLVYEGSGTAVWIPTLEDEIAKIDARCQEAGITTGEQKVIDDVVDEATALIKAIEAASDDDCQAMLDKLKAQYAAIAENVALQKEAESMYDFVFAAEDTYYDEADAELQARFDAVKDIFTEGDYENLNNEEIKAAIEEVKAVVNLMKMPKGWENASDENPVDFSAVIANRFFNVDGSEDPEEEPAAVQNHNFTEWQGKQPGTGGGQPANCGEVWNSGAFEMHQDLTGLPEGTYVLSCQGYLRHGGGGENSYKILTGSANQEVYAYLGATSDVDTCSVELRNIAEYAMTQEICDSLGITGDISTFNDVNGVKISTPEQLATADKMFKAGYYNNSVTVKVGADGVLRISIEKIGAVGQDWVVVDNFSLMYLGKNSSAESSEDQKTAIDDIAAPAQKAIYTITGLRVNKMAKPGLYIINGHKVLVK